MTCERVGVRENSKPTVTKTAVVGQMLRMLDGEGEGSHRGEEQRHRFPREEGIRVRVPGKQKVQAGRVFSCVRVCVFLLLASTTKTGLPMKRRHCQRVKPRSLVEGGQNSKNVPCAKRGCQYDSLCTLFHRDTHHSSTQP
ncbi:unnamed protein product, partial [Ectocarpus sp. 4 AP-2014]